MTLRRSFTRGNPVLDYWLGHSEGFELTAPGGRHRGVVQEVVIDELGYPRALIVRGGVLQRARVMNVDAVEAVVPADGTITLRGTRPRRTWPRIALPGRDPGRGLPPVLARTAVSAARIMWTAGVHALTLLVSAAGWSARRLRTNLPVLARRAGNASASAAALARPYGRRLVRLTGTAAVTVALVVFTLVHALAVAVAAYARFVAQEWTRRRSGSVRGV